MSVDSLIQYHPQWPDVREVDHQIAYLKGYSVSVSRPAVIPQISVPTESGRATPPNVEALSRTIRDRLDDAYNSQRQELGKRLGALGRRQTEAQAIIDREVISSWADGELGKILAARGPVLRNLEARLAVTDSLIKTNKERGWDHQTLDVKREGISAEVTSVRDTTSREMAVVLAEVQSRLDVLARSESEKSEKWLREHRQELDALDREILHQKSLLLDALRGFASNGTVQSGGTRGALREDPADLIPRGGTPITPVLPSDIQALRKHRADLVAFIRRDTQAIVRSAAERSGKQVTFTPAGGISDRTDDFRTAVKDEDLPEGR